MLGLLLKDLYTLKKQAMPAILVLGLYLVFSIFTGNFQMFATFTVFFAVMMPLTAMTYNERSECDKLMLCMPVDRKDIVLSHYFLGLILIGSSIIISGIILLVKPDAQMNFSVMFLFWGCCILYFAFYMPVALKIGVEKSRYVMMGALAVPAAIIIIYLKFKDTFGENHVAAWLSAQDVNILSAVFFAAGFLALIPSLLLSIRFYEAREM